jgi:hypothetical protein
MRDVKLGGVLGWLGEVQVDIRLDFTYMATLYVQVNGAETSVVAQMLPWQC